LSAAVLDNSGTLKYYGKLTDNIPASGSASVTLPVGLATTDTLRIFVEETNGDYLTDFASGYKQLMISSSGGSGSGGGGYSDTSRYQRPEPKEEPADTSTDTSLSSGTDSIAHQSAVGSFSDVGANDWYTPYAECVYQNGLMTGTSTTPMLFSPNTPITLGMIVTILYCMAGNPDVSGLPNPFTDVAGGKYYTDAVKWAAANGIVSGYGKGNYGPEDNITREQLAVILINYEKFSGKIPLDVLMDREFADWNDISGWARDAVNRLTIQGIISGKPGNLFDPAGEATRAEVATMLTRFIKATEQE
jgi:hypothetical protein